RQHDLRQDRRAAGHAAQGLRGHAPRLHEDRRHHRRRRARQAPGARGRESIPERKTPMTDAVIVSTARTPLCKSWKGALNLTHGAKMGGHVVHAALERARVDADEVEDVIIGCANPEGATGWNIAR